MDDRGSGAPPAARQPDRTTADSPPQRSPEWVEKATTTEAKIRSETGKILGRHIPRKGPKTWLLSRGGDQAKEYGEQSGLREGVCWLGEARAGLSDCGSPEADESQDYSKPIEFNESTREAAPKPAPCVLVLAKGARERIAGPRKRSCPPSRSTGTSKSTTKPGKTVCLPGCSPDRVSSRHYTTKAIGDASEDAGRSCDRPSLVAVGRTSLGHLRTSATARPACLPVFIKQILLFLRRPLSLSLRPSAGLAMAR